MCGRGPVDVKENLGKIGTLDGKKPELAGKNLKKQGRNRE
jgi:hypothetical protein